MRGGYSEDDSQLSASAEDRYKSLINTQEHKNQAYYTDGFSRAHESADCERRKCGLRHCDYDVSAVSRERASSARWPASLAKIN